MATKKKEVCPFCKKYFVNLSRHKCKKRLESISLDLIWKGLHSILKISKIKKTSSLQELHLRGNYIKTIEGLDHLVNLRVLDLSQNGISKISGLDKLVNLEVLKIADPQQYYEEDSMMGHADAWDRDYFEPLKKIEGLNNSVNLRVLDLCYNKIKKLDGLSNQKKLKKLFIRGNGLTDISGLKHLISLQELCLAGNKVSIIDYETVKNLKKLKICDLPIRRHIKTEKINDLISVRLIYHDLSRYGQFDGVRWDFYPEFTTKQLSCSLAIIYVKSEMFIRRCPEGPERSIVNSGGLKIKKGNDFESYCSELKKWSKSGCKAKIFPKHMTKPLLKMISDA